MSKDHTDSHFPITIFKLFHVVAQDVLLVFKSENKAVVIHLKSYEFRNQFTPDCITGVDRTVFFTAQSIIHAVAFVKAVSAKLVVGAEDMRQLMQQDVIERCRGAFNICTQKDPVYAVLAFTNKGRSVKVEIAILFVSVSQAIREILLAESLKDFLLVFRLKAAQHKVVLAELCPQAFIKGFILFLNKTLQIITVI